LVKQPIFTIRNERAAHDRSMRAALLVAIAGCVTRYGPGGLATDGLAEVHRLGCVDVGLGMGRRSEATGPVLVISLGNACEHSVAVDLSALHVVGGNDRGQTVAMVAYDPDHEIEPRRIDGLVQGDEWIEYQTTGSIEELAWLDVDVGAVVPEEPSAPRWVRLAVPR
jgi:hypothetical protein